MKPILTLIALALSSLSAHAIIIETPESLTFDLFWGQNDSRWGMPFHFDNGTRYDVSATGTEFFILGQHSANPYSFMVEIHPPDRSQWWNFMVTFPGWVRDATFQNIPDPVWGTSTAPSIGREIPADHLFAVAGNDHAVRIVVGALPVPEGGDTMTIMLLSLVVLVFMGRALSEN